MTKRKKHAKVLRSFREIHRTTGALLFIFFFIVSITAALLGWKKNSNSYLLPKSQVGVSNDLKKWLPVNSLKTIAVKTLQDSINQDINLELDRIDARPDKGMVKVLFKNHYWGVQIDATTGDVLSVAKRRSDLVENIHDGSILDVVFQTKGGVLKLIYTTIMSLALFIFTATGFWLWYGPKRMRKLKKK